MASQYSFTGSGPMFQPPPPAIPPEQAAMLRYFLDRPIRLPQAEVPAVSIIIPVFNQFEYTIACLHSLVHACAGNVSYEVILADDGSTDRTRTIAEQVTNLRIVRNDSGQHGFLPNVNFAAQFARGQYLFLLNNDTLLLENGGLLEHLTEHFGDPAVGVVGNRLMNTDGTVQHCVWLFESSGVFWDINSSGRDAVEGDAVEGSALMLRRDTWRELGGFDPVYGCGYFEESDLCFRIKTRKQQRVLCDTRSKIIHFGQRTFRNSAKAAAAFQQNARTFFQRWHDELTAREQGLPDGDPLVRRQKLYRKLYGQS